MYKQVIPYVKKTDNENWVKIIIFASENYIIWQVKKHK